MSIEDKAALFDALWGPVLVVFAALWFKAWLRRKAERLADQRQFKNMAALQMQARLPSWVSR